MSHATKRLFGILLSLGFFIGAFVIFSSLVIPEYRQIQQLKGENNSLAANLKEKGQAVETANRLLSQSQSFSSLRDSLSLSLPYDEDLPGIVNQIQGIAKTTGVAIDSLRLERLPIKPQDKNQTVEPVGTLRLTVRLRGTYESLKSYLGALETNIRVIDANSLTVAGGVSKDPVLNYTLVVDTYYQR